MYHFYKELKDWTLSHDDRLHLTLIESKGKDLKDMLANAVITLEDWRGNEGPDWELSDLRPSDYSAVEQMFVEHLATSGSDR